MINTDAKPMISDVWVAFMRRRKTFWPIPL